MATLRMKQVFHASLVYFYFLCGESAIIGTSATIRDNKLYFKSYERSYSLLKGEFEVKDFAITEGQPSEIQVGSILRFGENGELNFLVGRRKSAEVASWFNKQCDTSKCTTFGHAAGQLNFAALGTLRASISYKHNASKQYQVALDDILIGQGRIGSSNNWWFGGKTCSKIKDGEVASLGSAQHENSFALTFSRGRNQVDAVVIKNIKFLSWMKNVEDDKLLNELNMPGTHDSGTYNYDEPFTSPWVVTQSLSIEQQLHSGIRFLDIRCRHVNDSFVIHHGAVYVDLNFDDVLDQCISFLRENPSESIVMLINQEHTPQGNNRAFYQTFLSYVNRTSQYWYRGKTIPSVAHARGKIVLVYRFNFASDALGIDAHSWADNARFQIHGHDFTLDIQDQYDVSYAAKEQSIRSLLDSSRKKDDRYWYFNYISLAPSATRGTIIETSAYTNKFMHDIVKSQQHAFLGLVIMDYPNNQDSLTLDIVYKNDIL